MELQQKRARLYRVSTAIWLALALWLVISGIGLWEFAGQHVESTYIYKACSPVLERRCAFSNRRCPRIMQPSRIAPAR